MVGMYTYMFGALLVLSWGCKSRMYISVAQEWFIKVVQVCRLKCCEILDEFEWNFELRTNNSAKCRACHAQLVSQETHFNTHHHPHIHTTLTITLRLYKVCVGISDTRYLLNVRCTISKFLEFLAWPTQPYTLISHILDCVLVTSMYIQPSSENWAFACLDKHKFFGFLRELLYTHCLLRCSVSGITAKT